MDQFGYAYPTSPFVAQASAPPAAAQAGDDSAKSGTVAVDDEQHEHANGMPFGLRCVCQQSETPSFVLAWSRRLVYYIKGDVADALKLKYGNGCFVKLEAEVLHHILKNCWGEIVSEWDDKLTEYLHLIWSDEQKRLETKPDFQATFVSFDPLFLCDLQSEVKLKLSLAYCSSHEASDPRGFADIYARGRSKTTRVSKPEGGETAGTANLTAIETSSPDDAKYLDNLGRSAPPPEYVPKDVEFSDVAGYEPTILKTWKPNPKHCGPPAKVESKPDWAKIRTRFAESFAEMTKEWSKKNEITSDKGQHYGFPPPDGAAKPKEQVKRPSDDILREFSAPMVGWAYAPLTADAVWRPPRAGPPHAGYSEIAISCARCCSAAVAEVFPLDDHWPEANSGPVLTRVE